MAAALRTLLPPGLVILTALQLSSGEVYVRRGSDITDCSMECSHENDVLQLYRECGGDETQLLELWCGDMWLHNRYEPRLLYNTSTGCWSLRDAQKNDSCVYRVVYDNVVSRIIKKPVETLVVTVLDPVLISNITSNSSRLGEDIAVSVQYSGEEATVTWEVDGGLLPDRYRLMDDNRTVIIPRAQRDDAGRRLRVRIANPVSEETRDYQLKITDPVLISNITSNSSRLGEDIAVSVQYSGEEATVTWEVDGGLLPDRYRLIDDNRTVIIPRAQRDDNGRRLRVRITNPVSEETREYQLKITDPGRSHLGVYVAVGMFVVICIALLVKHRCFKKTDRRCGETHRRNRRSDQLLTDRSPWREEESPHQDPQNMGENMEEPTV